MSIRTVNSESKKVALLNRPSLPPSPSNSFSYSLSSFCVIAKKKVCKIWYWECFSFISIFYSQSVSFHWEDSPWEITSAMTARGLWGGWFAEEQLYFLRWLWGSQVPTLLRLLKIFVSWHEKSPGTQSRPQVLRTVFSLHLFLAEQNCSTINKCEFCLILRSCELWKPTPDVMNV